MWELGYKESWAQKNWWFWTVVLEKTLESPLHCKEIQPVHPKGNRSWIFTGRTDAEAETLIFWPLDAKSWLIWKDPHAGKDWGQEEKRTTEDEMVGWHHQFNGHGFGWTLGVGDGQGGLACCGSWGRKGSDTTERLNFTEPGRKDWSPSSHNWTNSWPCSNRNSSQNIVKFLQCAEKIVTLNLCTQQTSFKNTNEPGEEGLWERRNWEFGISRCKLSYTG